MSDPSSFVVKPSYAGKMASRSCPASNSCVCACEPDEAIAMHTPAARTAPRQRCVRVTYCSWLVLARFSLAR